MATTNKKGLLLALLVPMAVAQVPTAYAGGHNAMTRIDKLEKELSSLKMQVKNTSSSKSLINSGNDKVKVTLSGQVNRAFMVADDVKGRRGYSVDNDNSSTRFRIVGKAKMSSNFSVGSNFEVQFEPNTSTAVSQINATGTGNDNFTGRKFEIYFDHKDYGRLSIGKGSMASDDTAEHILSGTYNVSYSYVHGGFFFRQLGQMKGAFTAAANAGTIPTINQVFDNFDGLGRRDRVRYDTPSFNGFSFSTSFADRETWDLAPTYKYNGSNVKAIAAIGLADLADGEQFSSSASILSKNSGFSVSGSWSKRYFDLNGRDTAYQAFGQIGWQHDFFDFGRTHFAIDYTRSGNQFINDDKGFATGIGVEQKVKAISTELYASVRDHRYEQKGGVDFHRILIGMVGARIKF